ncbi:hypothetical protein ACFL1T_03955 [Chlamydiota bacterium]
MKKQIIQFVLLISLVTIIGCGGGGRDSNALSNITGSWNGYITFRLVAQPSSLLTYQLAANFIQTGSVVTGSYDILNGGSLVNTGNFMSTTRSGDVLSGLMDDGGADFDTPLDFIASVESNSITGQGAVTINGDDTTVQFTLNLV